MVQLTNLNYIFIMRFTFSSSKPISIAEAAPSRRPLANSLRKDIAVISKWVEGILLSGTVGPL